MDRSDLAEERDDVHVGRRVRSTLEDPDAAGKDQRNAFGKDDPPNSSPAPPDSALRIDRAAAYTAAVDAAYRQDAVDHDYARVDKSERETVSPAAPRTEAGDPERHLVSLENHANSRQRPAEAAELESFQVPDETTAAAWVGSALGERDVRVPGRTGDFRAVAQPASGDTCDRAAKTTPGLIRDASGFEYPAIGTAAGASSRHE